MSKEELKELLKPTFAYDTLGETGSFTEGVDELVDVLVAAYNKAIDDAVNELSKPENQIELGIVNRVFRLKI